MLNRLHVTCLTRFERQASWDCRFELRSWLHTQGLECPDGPNKDFWLQRPLGARVLEPEASSFRYLDPLWDNENLPKAAVASVRTSERAAEARQGQTPGFRHSELPYPTHNHKLPIYMYVYTDRYTHMYIYVSLSIIYRCAHIR